MHLFWRGIIGGNPRSPGRSAASKIVRFAPGSTNLVSDRFKEPADLLEEPACRGQPGWGLLGR